MDPLNLILSKEILSEVAWEMSLGETFSSELILKSLFLVEDFVHLAQV